MRAIRKGGLTYGPRALIFYGYGCFLMNASPDDRIMHFQVFTLEDIVETRRLDLQDFLQWLDNPTGVKTLKKYPVLHVRPGEVAWFPCGTLPVPFCISCGKNRCQLLDPPTRP